MENLVNLIIKLFGSLNKDLLVFIISLLPVLELRGGLLAASLLNLDPLKSYVLSILGNTIPVPFILLFINKILEKMYNSKIKWMRKTSTWLYKKADKNKSSIEKYGYIGLILFVGIPLPGTGAWTGCLIASLLNMNRKKSFISIFLGILLASVIMMFVSFGILKSLL